MVTRLYSDVQHQVDIHGWELASFPGLPRFVLWFAFRIVHRGGRALFRFQNMNQRTKTGNEASWEQCLIYYYTG